MLENKKITLTIPDYFSVRQYQMYEMFTSLDPVDQMVATIALLTEHTEDEVLSWPLPLISQAYPQVRKLISDTKPEFYPVIEWEGTLYGYRSLHRMTLKEYIDLEGLLVDARKNFTEILAILFRPVTENKLNTSGLIWNTVVKAYKGDQENVFKYYDIEEYDNEQRVVNAKKFENFPISVALGALSFFLLAGVHSLKSSEISSQIMEEWKKEAKKLTRKQKIKNRLLNTTVGYILSINLQNPPSFPSQEINPSLN
jgi:hypothetical protein